MAASSSSSLVNSLLNNSDYYSSTKTSTPPNTIKSLLLLPICHSLIEVSQLHAQLIVSGGLINHPFGAAKLVESYVSMSQIGSALSVFSSIPSPNVFVYNNIMRGLTLTKRPHDSILLYEQLLSSDLLPDNHTYTFVLKACSHGKALVEGEQVHCRIIKSGVPPNSHVHSSLVHMYANLGSLRSAECVLKEFPEENVLVKNALISGYMSHGRIEDARQVFDKMTTRDTASWSAMVTGYTKNGIYSEALEIFQQMMGSKIVLNESTLVSALSACSHLGALDQGRWIHAYISRVGVNVSVNLGSALADMYAKCGCIETSYEVFKGMAVKDVVSWGVIISGFARHGQAEKCFELYNEMVDSGTSPNEVIFVGILSACCYSGNIELGYFYFNKMVNDFGIRPSMEHYGCMVDLLGRAGRLAEAEEMIRLMPEEANEVVWGALLSGCRTHKDVKRGKLAFRQLMKLEPMSGDRYKQAGQMFADMGETGGAIEMRKIIEEKKLETTYGGSSLEVDGVVQEFMVGDVCNGRAQEIYEILGGF